VAVFEKAKFPRFHIGESLLPFSLATFERLGIAERMRDGDFLVKHGGEIVSGCGERELPFFFKDGYRARQPTSYQVLREEFDQLLLERAREVGAAVHEETAVESVAFDPEGVQLKVKGGGEHRCRFVIDASGRHSVVGTALGLKERYSDLRKFAVFSHYRGVERPEGPRGTVTRMVRARDRWFWMIPMADDLMSVGVVCDTEAFRASGLKPETFLEESIAGQPAVADRMRTAERVREVHSASDYSYRHRRLAGDRWLLAGDAAGFIDPVFSSGVFLALLSGESAADTVHSVLNGKGAPARLRRYERRLHGVMDLYLRFVRAWYRQEFIEVFLNPKEILQIAPAVNALLGGNTGEDFGIRWRVALFEFFVWLQRYLPLSPRLSLEPPKAVS